MGVPAEGARVAWQDVPESARAAIEGVCGAAVIEARTQPGGFSPGLAARVRCADGARWFVKAASAELNPDAPRLHRQEAMVLADLDPLILAGHLPVPRLRGTVEHGPWFALVVDDVDGLQAAHSAIAAELGPVFAGLFALGLLASGLASTSVGGYAGSVIMEGLLRRRIPIIWRRLLTAVPALILLGLGLEPTRLLILSQVILSFTLPFALIPLLILTNRRSVMETFVSARRTRIAQAARVAGVHLPYAAEIGH